ncbi:inosine triphosphate pyrophosphatase [Tuber magnatum]|uniref:Inosine triphosphate pyrophosphatase n=1 Tax=Tuber magnatum TaxID=42249 RepID=A0A317SJL1_9PEZI|nr:inosine triphosphate pyrophosphatase [Tuber magnatum]
MLRTLCFVTGNASKLAEVSAILATSGIKIQSRALDLPELQGNIEDISKHKAKQAAEAIGGPVLVEDTCLCFNALKGLPGPYVKWFIKGVGHEGLEPVLFQGRTDGKIVPARGLARFGWDPIFEYKGQTYAEMDKAVKNSISHRFKALEMLRKWMEAHV